MYESVPSGACRKLLKPEATLRVAALEFGHEKPSLAQCQEEPRVVAYYPFISIQYLKRERPLNERVVQGPETCGFRVARDTRVRRPRHPGHRRTELLVERDELPDAEDVAVEPVVAAAEAALVADDVPRIDVAVPRAAPARLAADHVLADRPDRLRDLAVVARVAQGERGPLAPVRRRVLAAPVARLLEGDVRAVLLRENVVELDAVDARDQLLVRTVGDQLRAVEGRSDGRAVARRHQQALLERRVGLDEERRALVEHVGHLLHDPYQPLTRPAVLEEPLVDARSDRQPNFVRAHVRLQ